MKFKVLSYCDNYVDAILLGKGIYATTAPRLYDNNESIENLIELAKISVSLGNVITPKYIENLEKCELISAELIKCV